MKKFFLAGSIVAALFILNLSVAQAQITYVTTGIPAGGTGAPGTATQTANVTTTIAPVLDLAVATGQTVDFQFSTIALLDAGIVKTGAVNLTFRSNNPWFVNVAANTADFTGGSDAAHPMPSSVLQYRLGGTTSFIPVTTTPSSVTGAAGSENARGAGTILVDYSMNPGYNTAPGTDYALVLTYTISNL